MEIDKPQNNLDALPETPGVYRFYDQNGELLYVGKAKNLRKRVPAYFEGREHGPHIVAMAKKITKLVFETTSSEVDALLLEQNLIKKHKPRFNIIFRDDKSYTYIELSKDEFPQLRQYRGQKNSAKNLFGPYPNAGTATNKIDAIQQLFQLRTCNNSTFNNRSRPCILNQIGKCSAPCMPGRIPANEYNFAVQKAEEILKGNIKRTIQEMSKEMQGFSLAMEFEKAATIRDLIQKLTTASSINTIESSGNENLDATYIFKTGASIKGSTVYIRDGRVENISSATTTNSDPATQGLSSYLEHIYFHTKPASVLLFSQESVALVKECTTLLQERWGIQCQIRAPQSKQEALWLAAAKTNAEQLDTNTGDREAQKTELLSKFPNFPGKDIQRIECFDISHFQAENAVASCVVFLENKMDRESYKIYGISPENAGDDFASMKEVLIRRYQTANSEELPDIIIIDGGRGQLKKAQEALDLLGLKIPLLGMAKGETRKIGNETLLNSWGDPEIKMSKDNPALLLLAMIRDESHRFAIKHNRKKNLKSRVKSRLEEIPGIGPAKRKALLLAFGSAKAVAEAGEQQLMAIPGISKTLAYAIRESLKT